MQSTWVTGKSSCYFQMKESIAKVDTLKTLT